MNPPVKQHWYNTEHVCLQTVFNTKRTDIWEKLPFIEVDLT